MQHVEEAGFIPATRPRDPADEPQGEMLEEIRETTRRIALELGVIGLISVQYGSPGAHVIEANPAPADRALRQQGDGARSPDRRSADAGRGLTSSPCRRPQHVSVKEAVLPFARFAGATPCSAR
jgi:carbamoyl-phosphate synthase large subunit